MGLFRTVFRQGHNPIQKCVPFIPKRNLPRLERPFYRGHAAVFWTLTLEGRDQGWLTQQFHFRFREVLAHVGFRYQIWSPVYCLMPDHLHLMWMGLRTECDQLNAMRFLRTVLEPALGPGRKWQHQAHDHVLREDERRRIAFARICDYVLTNPVRAKLVTVAEQWPFQGCLVPGYPALQPQERDYWLLFWKLYLGHRNAEPLSPAKNSS